MTEKPRDIEGGMRRPNICLMEIQEVQNSKDRGGAIIGEIMTEKFAELMKDINPKLHDYAGSKTSRVRGRRGPENTGPWSSCQRILPLF